MRERPLQQLAPLPQEPLATLASNPTTIRVHRISLDRLALPVATATIRLRAIRANPQFPLLPHGPVAVVALVRHRLGQHVLGRMLVAVAVVVAAYVVAVGAEEGTPQACSLASFLCKKVLISPAGGDDMCVLGR